MTDLQVSFDVTSGFDSLEAPDKLPTIFNGDKTVIYGIFRSKAASNLPLEAGVSGTASLKGKVVGVPFEHTIPFKIPPPSDSPDSDSFQMPIVHHLAAKSLIHDWEHKEGWASTASDSECKQEMIRVSVESSVVSSHTAYIAVDEEQDKPIEGAIQMWDLSATMAACEGGWGYGGPVKSSKNAKYKKKGSAYPAMRAYAAAPMRQSKARSLAGRPAPSLNLSHKAAQIVSSVALEDKMPEFLEHSPSSRTSSLDDDDMFFNSAPAKSASRSAKMKGISKSSSGSAELTQLISLQLAEGFWRFDKVSTFMKKPISCPISGVESTVWATVIALVLLESRFSQQNDEWELVAMKAETWLNVQSLPSGVDIQKIKEEAKKLF